MELALYAPGLGYYSAGSTKIGSSGDFVTAPEISDLFSRCVARQCAQVLSDTGGEILELGAGTGRMAAAVLESLAAAGVLPDRYSILEVSADLAERQRERLATLPASLRKRVVWLERLPRVPFGVSCWRTKCWTRCRVSASWSRSPSARASRVRLVAQLGVSLDEFLDDSSSARPRRMARWRLPAKAY